MQKNDLYALKSQRAYKLKSVLNVNENALNLVKDGYFLGVKNTPVINDTMVSDLANLGYIKHTLDRSSDGGRAIDINLENPITTRKMTGSSSGSAINVFLNVNDIAIATDGGGSVLAPALSLNLYGFISPLLYQDTLKQFEKTSTDGIKFHPSIGFIFKDFDVFEPIQHHYFNQDSIYLNVCVAKSDLFAHAGLNIDGKEVILNYDNASRELMMEELKQFDFEHNILITMEGPIDVFAYGDSIIGHYCDWSKANQMQGHKYYLTVVNMLNLSAIVVPSTNLATGYLLICKSDALHINKMLEIAKSIPFNRSTLEESYFAIEGGFISC